LFGTRWKEAQPDAGFPTKTIVRRKYLERKLSVISALLDKIQHAAQHIG
jgi:hypothetical protein